MNPKIGRKRLIRRIGEWSAAATSQARQPLAEDSGTGQSRSAFTETTREAGSAPFLATSWELMGGGTMIKRRDAYAGLLMVLLGLGAAFQGSRYEIGNLTHMGPGFFPTALGVLLAMVGAAIALAGAREEASEPPTQIFRVEWRGWGCIVGSIVVFIILADHAGLALATFATVFVAAMGDRQSSWKASLALAAGITVFGVLLFSYGLHVQVPIFHGIDS